LRIITLVAESVIVIHALEALPLSRKHSRALLDKYFIARLAYWNVLSWTRIRFRF